MTDLYADDVFRFGSSPENCPTCHEIHWRHGRCRFHLEREKRQDEAETSSRDSSPASSPECDYRFISNGGTRCACRLSPGHGGDHHGRKISPEDQE